MHDEHKLGQCSCMITVFDILRLKEQFTKITKVSRDGNTKNFTNKGSRDGNNTRHIPIQYSFSGSVKTM